MIDGGPLRASQPSGRRVAYRSESFRSQPDEPETTEQVAPIEAPRQPLRAREVEEPVVTRKPRNLSWVKWVAMSAAVVVLAAAAWLYLPNQSSIAATIDASKYQAVFLSNGQVYFGKLEVVGSGYMKLSNVYYLERQITTGGGDESESDVNTSEPSGDNSFQLLKYSDVLYGSEDAMIISSDDIVRFENLRPDGVVAKAIANRQ